MRSSHRHDFFFLMDQMGVDLGDVLVGQLLNLALRSFHLVLGDAAHSPVQLEETDWVSRADMDPELRAMFTKVTKGALSGNAGQPAKEDFKKDTSSGLVAAEKLTQITGIAISPLVMPRGM